MFKALQHTFDPLSVSSKRSTSLSRIDLLSDATVFAARLYQTGYSLWWTTTILGELGVEHFHGAI